MRITNVIIASCILGTISAADQHEEMRCKARPGCQLAKCESGLLSSSSNANEYPVTCVRTSAQDGGEYKELKSEMTIMRTELNALRIKTNDLESHRAKQNTALVRSCDGAQLESALAHNDSGGVFNSYIPTIGFRGVYCDVTDDGGNWTVFQRRMNGAVDFYRGWDDFVKGFGDLQGDHWLGLEALHQLTKGGDMEMKIKMISRKGIHLVARYSSFRIGPGSDKYRLHISGYSGNSTLGDGLEYSNNWQFSTKDADHDWSPGKNCASDWEGAGWYGYDCAQSNLNGNFHASTSTRIKGIWWRWTFDLVRFSEMKIRKKKRTLVRSCEGAQLESAVARSDSGGVFNSYIPTIGFRGVFCDVTDDGGNWTVFQRRMNGVVDFYRGWDDYVKGFGDLQGDHWLGLEALHQLTKGGDMELKIKMILWKGIHLVARYSSFRIGPGSDNYTMHVSGFSGNVSYDALALNNNRQFSTYDADNAGWPLGNCASYHEAGWWYATCGSSNLNGDINGDFWWSDDADGDGYAERSYLPRFSEMKFRERA